VHLTICKIHPVSGEDIAMLTVQQGHSTQLIPPLAHRRDRHSVHLSTRIDADIRRVFHALSIPEYIEAWLHAPSADELLTFSRLSQERLHIDMYRSGSYRASIHVSIRPLSRTHIRYAWIAISPSTIDRTWVDLQLPSAPSESCIHLTHRNLCTPSQRIWYEETWHASLNKLRAIVQSGGGRNQLLP
jgi:uncharacterized protein YndB with AHSA1/START domain